MHLMILMPTTITVSTETKADFDAFHRRYIFLTGKKASQDDVMEYLVKLANKEADFLPEK